MRRLLVKEASPSLSVSFCTTTGTNMQQESPIFSHEASLNRWCDPHRALILTSWSRSRITRRDRVYKRNLYLPRTLTSWVQIQPRNTRDVLKAGRGHAELIWLYVRLSQGVGLVRLFLWLRIYFYIPRLQEYCGFWSSEALCFEVCSEVY